MFLMWETIVLITAACLLLPNHNSTVTVFFFLSTKISAETSLNDLVKVPRGPLTVTTRARTSTSSTIFQEKLKKK